MQEAPLIHRHQEVVWCVDVERTNNARHGNLPLLRFSVQKGFHPRDDPARTKEAESRAEPTAEAPEAFRFEGHRLRDVGRRKG